jgi:hypothetical protein
MITIAVKKEVGGMGDGRWERKTKTKTQSQQAARRAQKQPKEPECHQG